MITKSRDRGEDQARGRIRYETIDLGSHALGVGHRVPLLFMALAWFT